MKKYGSVESVKEELGVTDLTNLNEKSLNKYIKMKPQIANGVGAEIINGLPPECQTIQLIIKLCDNQISKAGKSHSVVMETYKNIIDTYAELMKKDEISSEERKDYSAKVDKYLSVVAIKDKNFKVGTAGILVVEILVVAKLITKLVKK